MSIELKITDEDKRLMLNMSTEAQVLFNLHKERKVLMDNKAMDILKANNLDTRLYFMTFNGGNGQWEAHLKQGALAVPVPGSNVKNIRGNGG